VVRLLSHIAAASGARSEAPIEAHAGMLYILCVSTLHTTDTHARSRGNMHLYTEPARMCLSFFQKMRFFFPVGADVEAGALLDDASKRVPEVCNTHTHTHTHTHTCTYIQAEIQQ
jgi:hypothetical protein